MVEQHLWCSSTLFGVCPAVQGALGDGESDSHRGMYGACEPHVSLTHKSELNHDGNARQGDGNALRVLPAACWRSWGVV